MGFPFSRRPTPEQLLRRFLDRYRGRSLIVHRGFPPQWLEELLKQPGGGGHLRLDLRTLNLQNPTPVEWFVGTHVLPLGLPSPLLAGIEAQRVLIRHLNRGELPVHPSEILWFLDEMDTRHHMCLHINGDDIVPEPGIPTTDNEARSMMEHLGL